MAAANAALPTTDTDETQLIARLAHLERLKDQLDDLRPTLRSIVQPLHRTPDPAMFHAFKDGLSKSQSEMKYFRNQWFSPETQAVLDYARKSAATNQDLSAGAQVHQYGWIEKEEKEKEAAQRNKDGEVKVEEVGVHITKEERAKIVGEWRKANAGIRMEGKDEEGDLSIQFAADSFRYRFHVTISDDANAPPILKAECEGKGDPYATVTRCIASRPNANDMRYLLDMIAAYKTVSSIHCAKCERLLDIDTTRPFARRSRQVPGANETVEMVWEAFHEGCLD